MLSKKYLFFLLFSIPCFPLKISLQVRNKPRIILIGAAGKKGQEYYHLLKNDVEFVGFVQLNPQDSFLSFAQQEGIPVYKNIDAIPIDCFDGALITTPHYSHYLYTDYLIARNKFVIKEKPLAIEMKHVEKYKKFVFDKKSVLFTIVQRQFQDSFLEAQQQLKNLGEIYSFNYKYILGLHEKTTGWRARKDLSGGGVVIDMGYHVIDILTIYFGYPEKVFPFFTKNSPDPKAVEEEAFIIFQYPQKTLGFVTLSRYGTQREEVLEIYCQKGFLKIFPDSYSLYDEKGFLIQQVASSHSSAQERKAMLLTFLDKRNDKVYQENEFKRHVANMEIISRIYQNEKESQYV